jgi:hypothetical protein
MDDNEKNPPEEKKPSSTGKKLHLDLSEAMISDIDDDDDIIELKDEVTFSPKEMEPEIDPNDLQSPEFSPETSPEVSPKVSPKFSIDKPSEEKFLDFETLRTEFAETENNVHGTEDLSFEEEDEDNEDDVEIPFLATEQPLQADDTNEVMEITEFDDIMSEDDNEMITLLEDREESDPEEEFLELIEVEEDSLPEAVDEKMDEKIEEEIIQFDEPETEVEDQELENFINDSLNEEIQIGDELEDDLINSLGIEAGPEINLTDQTSESEEFNFNVDTSEISEKIDRLDTIFFDDTQSETEYNDEAASESEDSDSETQNEDIRITEMDSLEQPTSGVAPPDLGIDPDQIEQSIERFIEQNYSEKIESMITAIIEKAVAKEINRLKNVLMKDNDTEDF